MTETINTEIINLNDVDALIKFCAELHTENTDYVKLNVEPAVFIDIIKMLEDYKECKGLLEQKESVAWDSIYRAEINAYNDIHNKIVDRYNNVNNGTIMFVANAIKIADEVRDELLNRHCK